MWQVSSSNEQNSNSNSIYIHRSSSFLIFARSDFWTHHIIILNNNLTLLFFLGQTGTNASSKKLCGSINKSFIHYYLCLNACGGLSWRCRPLSHAGFRLDWVGTQHSLVMETDFFSTRIFSVYLWWIWSCQRIHLPSHSRVVRKLRANGSRGVVVVSSRRSLRPVWIMSRLQRA